MKFVGSPQFLIPFNIPHGHQSQHYEHPSMLAVIQAKADQQLTTATGIPVPIASYLFVSAVNGSDANRKRYCQELWIRLIKRRPFPSSSLLIVPSVSPTVHP